jgi:hypothetical protein
MDKQALIIVPCIYYNDDDCSKLQYQYGFGFISFALIKTVSGKGREVKPVMWVIVILSILFLTLDRFGGMIDYLKTLID